MNGGSESGGGDNYGGGPMVQVPIGWQRRVEPSTVVYISPSGTILTSMDQLRTYLVTDGTCKCGLECPLNIYKVFNFDPRAVVKRRSAEDVKAEEDMTKLCNHRRKIVALAALYKSIESTPLALQSQAAGCGSSQSFNATSTSPKMGQHPCSLDPDIFTKLMMEKAHNMSAHHLEKTLDHKSDTFTPHPGERYSDLRSNQRPALPRQHRTSLGESYALRNCPPVPSNGNYEVFSRTPQAICHELSTSSFTQVTSSQNRPSYPSCSQELSGLSPKPLALNSCSFVPGGTFNRTLDESIQGPQRSFVLPEKDPLGILDYHSCRPPSPKHRVLNSPPLIQSQVPLINTHPTSEHNPGNHSSTALPPPFSPFTRSGVLTSPSTTRSSISSISSPAGSVEPSPQRSRHSSASSEHFPAPIRSSSRSPRPVSSPKRSVPHSPKAILEGHPPFGQAQLGSSSNASHALTHQSNKTAPPVSLGAAQGLLGFPLGCILGQQASASFPASSLLTAAAKAQMANQTKPDATAPSTLPSRVLNPNTLLSAAVMQEGQALTSRTHSQKRDLLVKRKRQRNSPGPEASPQDVSGHNPTSPSGLSRLNSCLKLAGTAGQLEEDMGRSKVIYSHSVSGHAPPSLQMPRSLVEESPCQSKTPSLSPASQDISNHLLGLVGQLVQTSTEQNSGTSLPLKLPSTPTSATSSSGRPSQSPLPKSPVPSLPQSHVADGSNEMPCSLTNAGDSFPLLGHEHVMPFSATPALLNLAMLGSLPLSLSLNQHQQLLNQGLLNLLSSSLLGSTELGLLGLQNPPMALPSAMGDPDSSAVQALLMASLLHNPLLPLGGLGLPQLDLPPQNQQQSALLSSLAPLLDALPAPQNDTTEKHETSMTLPETFPENALQPLLFPPVSASPALIALNSALLAASLGAVDSSACPGQSCINASCTGSSSITTTTNSPALSEGKLPPSEPHSPFHLHQPQPPGRLHTLMPPLLNPLLTAGLLGDLAALNTSAGAQMGSLQSLLGAHALLQNQQAFLPSLPGALGMHFFHGQSLLQGQRTNNQNHSSSSSEKDINPSPHPEICVTPTSQIPSSSQQTLDSSFPSQRTDLTNKSQTLPLTPSGPGSFVSNTSSAFESSPIPKGPPFQGPVHIDLPPDTPSDPPRTDTLSQSMDPSASETEPEVSPLKKCRLLTDSVIPSEIPNGASPNILPWMGSPHPSNTVNHPESLDLSKGKERGYRFNGRSRAERSYGRRPRGDRLSSSRHSYWRFNGEDTSQNDGEEAGQSQEIAQPVLGIPPFTHHWHEEREQPREQEVDVPPQLLKRSRRGRRRGQNSQRMGSRIEAVPAKWPTIDPANGLNAERPIIRQNRPGRPAKNRRRRII
ncbi:methyl-CpG-binding domain protein 6 [Bufo gargarizans]|uniref:methyl-CpG-binding domain protein 6 n=1 Tax=Bufo gargarizans TaxID=30331 RepID=UPI001CF4A61C|nr:methyl-CpG-binding domain protein 6 [Bufo gargarizans]XP_044142841.1 methyl-CpG-binding domain protein 6 [Bufo gargarizans]